MAETLVYNIKSSTVVPANISSPDAIFEPGNMDLAMKLHYLRIVYYFDSRAFEGLDILSIKKPMFEWLNQFPMTCGRFRRAETGRAYIKCNDCGVRVIEAECAKTLNEWLEKKDDELEKSMVSNQVIGPELTFSPLVLLQFTKFKCGGMAVGLSWAHVLGDTLSAAKYINLLGRAAARHKLSRPINTNQYTPSSFTSRDNPPKLVEDPISLKRVDPVGDNWICDTKCKMETFSFHVPPTQLSHLQAKLSPNENDFHDFETLCALIWQCIARIREIEFEPKIVTICKSSEGNKSYGTLSNSQVVSVVKAGFSIVEAKPSELASLVKNRASLDEREKIEELMVRDDGLADFIIYGANLTFVNLEEAELYEFEYMGQKPVNVSLRVDGVGEQGAVLFYRRPHNGGGGWVVKAILPENDVLELKLELKREGIMT